MNKLIKVIAKEYQHLLNNLLDIKPQDPAIYFKVNNHNQFDLTTKVNSDDVKKVLQPGKFRVGLNDNDLPNLISAIKQAKNGSELINFLNDYHEKVTHSLTARLEHILLTEDEFQAEKRHLIEKLEIKFQNRYKNWTLFLKKFQSILSSEGIYLLHVGTFFIRVRVGTKAIYAPMFLKKVELVLYDKKVMLHSVDHEWFFNEKLRFMLERYGFVLPPELINNTANLQERLTIFNNWAQNSIVFTHLTEPFVNFKSDEVKSVKIEFQPGSVFGFINPLGGRLRQIMQHIIEHKQVDEILDVAFDKQKYVRRINRFIKSNNRLVEIIPMNFQQKKALISSLKQNTIIWGPPGTGKSQVIANLIANIMTNAGQKVLVVSRKKTALDILWYRLGPLKIFTFFMIDRNIRYNREFNKADFYAPLSEFIALVEKNKFYLTDQHVNYQKSMLKPQEHDAFRAFYQALNNGAASYIASLKVFALLNGVYDQELTDLPWLDGSYIYADVHDFKSHKQYVKSTALLNGVKKKLWFWYPRKFANSVKQVFAFSLRWPDLDTNALVKNLQQTNLATINTLLTHKKFFYLEPEQTEVNNAHAQTNIVNKIVKIIQIKIKKWEQIRSTDPDAKYKQYVAFAAAVRAGRLLPWTFLRRHQTIINQLFSVFVTTPELLLENWIQRSYFDYVIIDEASQMFTEMGLPLMWLAKIKVIAGDQQQLQPSSWFQIRHINNDPAEDTPEHASSVLDYARDKGVLAIMLDKNYRSESAALMAFSSKHFYESKLQVIDRFNRKTHHPIEVVSCPSGRWVDGQNQAEASLVLKLCLKNFRNKLYQKIIILTFNAKQRKLLEEMIIDNVQYRPVEKRWNAGTIMVKNIENIQGDEADLVIMSVVYDKTTQTAGTYVARRGGKNALNVAISRAKQKVIVVKSVTAAQIRFCKSDDFRIFKTWLEFLDLSSAQQKVYSIAARNPITTNVSSYTGVASLPAVKSSLVRNLHKRFKSANLRLISGYKVGSLTIDLVVVSQSQTFLLGLMVDGTWRDGLDAYHQDKDRQVFLVEKGFTIYRIKQIDWAIDKSRVIKKINRILRKKYFY